jgi:hypothetical protein
MIRKIENMGFADKNYPKAQPTNHNIMNVCLLAEHDDGSHNVRAAIQLDNPSGKNSTNEKKIPTGPSMNVST